MARERRGVARAGDQGCAAGAERPHLVAQCHKDAGERAVHGLLGALLFTAALPVQLLTWPFGIRPGGRAERTCFASRGSAVQVPLAPSARPNDTFKILDHGPPALNVLISITSVLVLPGDNSAEAGETGFAARVRPSAALTVA